MFRKKIKNSSSSDNKKKNKLNSSINLDDDNYKSVIELKKDNFKDLIAPDYANFAISPKYFEIGEIYSKSLYVGILPASVDFPVYLDNLYNGGDINTSIYISPMSVEQSLKDLSKLRNDALVELQTTVGNNRKDDVAAREYEATRQRIEVREGKNKLYDVAIIANIFADDLKELDNVTERLKTDLSIKDIGLKNAIYMQEEGYKSNMPLNNNTLPVYKPHDKRSLACVFPFTTSNLNHRGGMPIGINKDNGLPIIYNNFSDELRNYNIIIIAPSGSGKSTFLKMLSGRTSTLDDIINFAIDFEGEYNDIALTLGGKIFKLEQGTDSGINFFDVTEDIDVKTGKEFIDIDNLIVQVTSIIGTLSKGVTGNNGEYYNDILISIIREGVQNIYNKLGITSDPQSLYEEIGMSIDSKGKILGGKTKKKMPTLSDYYKLLEDMRIKNTIPTKEKYFDYLIAVLAQYVKCKNGSFTCFDGESKLKITTDCPFTNFDVSKLDENTQLPIAQHIINSYLWENVIKRNVTGLKIRLIVEEAWKSLKVINGVPKYPEIVSFIETLARRARKRNTSLVLVTQEHKDIDNPVTEAIFTSCATKVLLPPEQASIDELQDAFKLTDGEFQFISTMKSKEALIKADNISVKGTIDIPDFEMEFVETNQNKKFANLSV